MPEVLPGPSDGKLPRSKGEEGKEEVDEEEDPERRIRNDVTRGIVAGVLKEADTVGGGATRNTVPATQCINVKGDSNRRAKLGGERKDEWKDIEQRVRQNGIALKLRTVLKKEMLWTGMKTMI